MMIDRKAVGQTVALLLLSWAAFPFIYYLLAKRNKRGGKNVADAGKIEKEKEKEVKKENGKENMG